MKGISTVNFSTSKFLPCLFKHYRCLGLNWVHGWKCWGWKVCSWKLGAESSGVKMSWHLLTVPLPAWKISKLSNLDSWKWWLTCLYLSQGSTAKSIYSSMFIVCLYLIQYIIYEKIIILLFHNILLLLWISVIQVRIDQGLTFKIRCPMRSW